MAGSVDILNPHKLKRFVVVASNPAVSNQTGWLISLGFINSPEYRKLTDAPTPIRDVHVGDYDGALLVGGQGPMYTFFNDEGCINWPRILTKRARLQR